SGWLIRPLYFFFSSRRRHTRSDRDWSSDVCSSDLYGIDASARSSLASAPRPVPRMTATSGTIAVRVFTARTASATETAFKLSGRSEERRVGKEGRSGLSSERENKRESVV